MTRKILIMGLPGAGKTTLASALAPLLNAVMFNADAVRANLSRDLGFNIFYGRDIGYTVERIELDATTETISATKLRALSLTP